MSYVTNVMIQWGPEDQDTLEKLNKGIEVINNGQIFRSLVDDTVGELWGGSKYPEVDLVAAAFNYWQKRDSLKALAEYPWRDRECVRLFICEQDDLAFSMYELTANKEWRKYA